MHRCTRVVPTGDRRAVVSVTSARLPVRANLAMGKGNALDDAQYYGRVDCAPDAIVRYLRVESHVGRSTTLTARGTVQGPVEPADPMGRRAEEAEAMPRVRRSLDRTGPSGCGRRADRLPPAAALITHGARRRTAEVLAVLRCAAPAQCRRLTAPCHCCHSGAHRRTGPGRACAGPTAPSG